MDSALRQGITYDLTMAYITEHMKDYPKNDYSNIAKNFEIAYNGFKEAVKTISITR